MSSYDGSRARHLDAGAKIRARGAHICAGVLALGIAVASPPANASDLPNLPGVSSPAPLIPASRTISGKFGFGPFFGHISRFTGYIVLTASTTPAWGHEPSTVCRRQANSSATIAESHVASAHWPIERIIA